MPRPKGPHIKSQFNIYLRNDFRELLDQIALAETDKRGVTITAADLVREATIDRYKLYRRIG
jgi:hypothetical protein